MWLVCVEALQHPSPNPSAFNHGIVLFIGRAMDINLVSLAAINSRGFVSLCVDSNNYYCTTQTVLIEAAEGVLAFNNCLALSCFLPVTT